MPRAPKPRARPSDALLLSILDAPDREQAPLARPVVSYAEQDEGSFLGAIERCAMRSVTLERRGIFHGHWAELDERRMPRAARPTRRPALGSAAFEAELARRWHATRPILLPDVAADLVRGLAREIEAAEVLRDRLSEKGGLARWIAEAEAELEPAFRPIARRTALHDPARDIERVRFASFAPGGGGRPVDDLWLKSSWLSTFEDDASLRLRFSFGREVADDASRDILKHRLVADLAQRLLPECAAVAEHPVLGPLLERLSGESVLFTQPIAYWNSPQGGASFHHDAFAEDAHDGGAWRQLGVCYVQLSGTTAWLALSLEDLVLRVREFLEALAEGQLPWVKAQLFDAPSARVRGGFERWRRAADDGAALVAELALPGCGEIGPLVDRGPEFTSFLADAGHAFVLDPGDAIVLPNQGLHATCMHSVFCAGAETGYSLSIALRPDRAAPEEVAARARTHARKPPRDGRRAR